MLAANKFEMMVCVYALQMNVQLSCPGASRLVPGICTYVAPSVGVHSSAAGCRLALLQGRHWHRTVEPILHLLATPKLSNRIKRQLH